MPLFHDLRWVVVMNRNSHIERLTGLNNMTADAQTTNGAMLSAIMVLAMIYWRCLDKKVLHNRHHMYIPAMGSCLKLFKCLDGICAVRSQFTIGEDIWSHQEASYTDYIDHMDVLGFGCPHITVIFCWKWWMVIFVFLNYRLAKVSPNKLLSYQYMQSRDRIIFIMGILIPGETVFSDTASMTICCT